MQGQEKPRNLGFGLGAVEFNVTGRRLVQTSKSWIHTDRRLLVAFRRRKLMVNMGDAQIPRREMPCLAACLRRQPVRGASPGIQKVQILMSRATGLRLATGILYGSSKSKWRRYECGLRLCKALPCKNRLRCKPSSRLLVRLAARLGTCRQRHGSTLAVDAANVAIRHHPAQKEANGHKVLLQKSGSRLKSMQWNKSDACELPPSASDGNPPATRRAKTSSCPSEAT